MKCAQCGKEFEAKKRGRRQKYCSTQCRMKARWARKKLGKQETPKKCAYCGAEFEPNSSTQKYCSTECRGKAYHAPVERESKICPYCGKEFEPKYTIQKYCSRQCGKKVNSLRALKSALQAEGFKEWEPTLMWKPARRKCLNCGAEFVEHFRGDKFCSDDCCWNYYEPEVRFAIWKVLEDKFLCK